MISSCNTKVLVSREEVAVMLMVKVGMELSPGNFVRVVKDLHWQCFGACSLITHDGAKRTVVGCAKHGDPRRDFIRVKGKVGEDTALSVQVCGITTKTILRTFFKVRSLDEYVTL